MKYLNYLTDELGVESEDHTLINQMIKASDIMNLLKLKGYKFIHFSSGWGPTDSNSLADYNINTVFGNDFMMVLTQTTILKAFEHYFGLGYINYQERQRRLETFSQLGNLNNIEGPKFIFAHIMCPHPPFLFGANGEHLLSADLEMTGNIWLQKTNYLNQVIFVNKKVEIMVNEILKNSETSPIIVIQGDHGPASTATDHLSRLTGHDHDHGDSTWVENPTNNMIKERTRILNAYYLPSGGNRLLYDSITPVNTFRLIFNYYFNTNYELLDDSTYWSSYHQPFKFLNVTDRMN
jgi:hypothetical protein